MLYKAKGLKGYRLQGRDGKFGKVKEFYFDDHYLTIRYLSVETRNWSPGTKVPPNLWKAP